MTAPRSTKQEHIYRKHRSDDARSGDCPFCSMHAAHPQFVRETQYFKVVRNRTAYSLWDNQSVTEHLMLVPKQHTSKLAELSDKAATEYTRLVGQYEMDGYNIYTRAIKSANRSVPHHHTHLLKLNGKVISFLFMIAKPWYVRLSK